MKIRRVIKGKIFNLTKTKQAILQEEFDNYNAYLRGNKDVGLYSATKQGANAVVRNIKKRKGKIKANKKYPLYLRNDVFKLVKKDTKITSHWIKIPVHRVRGGIWCPIIIPENQIKYLEDNDCKIKDSKLIWKKDYWLVHIVLEKEIEPIQPKTDNVIGIDFGEKNIATSIEFNGHQLSNPKFYGVNVRGIRRHYAWLRKRLGKKKAFKTIKKIGSKERKKVDVVLHKISKDIVERAKEINATIVLGSPNGEKMRKSAKGKRFRRIVYSIPYSRLSQFIEYKALWNDVPIIYENEAYTSKDCHVCGDWLSRPYQGLVICKNCGMRCHADLNASMNLTKRFWNYMFQNGVALGSAHNSEVMSLAR